MSTVGKVLVVAQVAFSVLLMGFAAGVSAIQTNWKQKEIQVADNLKKANDELSNVRTQMEQATTAHTASEKASKDTADKFRGLADAANAKNQQLGVQLNQTRTELENVRAEAKIAGEESRARRDEAVSLRGINEQIHKKLDEIISANRQQADKIVNLEQESRTMVEKHNKTLADLAIVQKFIRVKGFDSDPKELAGLSEPPPVLEAVVLSRKKGGRNGSDLVEVNLGSDAGLAKGHEMFVYRRDGRGKYLGKIRLDYVDYDKAVGVVIQSTKNGEIQTGDVASTKL